MKKREVQILYKAMLPQLPMFVTDGRKLLLLAPIGHTLRGVLIDSSAYSKEDFYLHWFFMPMCTPIDYLVLSYGDRIDQPDVDTGWNSQDPDVVRKLIQVVQKEALPQLLKLKTSDAVIAEIQARAGDRDVNALIDIAYLYILEKRFGEAKANLEKITVMDMSNDRKWVKDIGEQARFMLNELRSNPKVAFEKVRKWQDDIFKNLKLEKWR